MTGLTLEKLIEAKRILDEHAAKGPPPTMFWANYFHLRALGLTRCQARVAMKHQKWRLFSTGGIQ